MKVNELRPNCLVYVNNPKFHHKLKDVVLCVIGLHPTEIEYSVNLEHVNQKPNTYYETYSQFISFIEPIQLTEEWLLRFGFKLEKDVDYFYVIKTKQKGITLEVEPNGRTILFDNKNIKFIDILPIKYVHQLQNLYFAITGEELEVK